MCVVNSCESRKKTRDKFFVPAAATWEERRNFWSLCDPVGYWFDLRLQRNFSMLFIAVWASNLCGQFVIFSSLFVGLWTIYLGFCVLPLWCFHLLVMSSGCFWVLGCLQTLWCTRWSLLVDFYLDQIPWFLPITLRGFSTLKIMRALYHYFCAFVFRFII